MCRSPAAALVCAAPQTCMDNQSAQPYSRAVSALMAISVDTWLVCAQLRQFRPTGKGPSMASSFLPVMIPVTVAPCSSCGIYSMASHYRVVSSPPAAAGPAAPEHSSCQVLHGPHNHQQAGRHTKQGADPARCARQADACAQRPAGCLEAAGRVDAAVPRGGPWHTLLQHTGSDHVSSLTLRKGA